jgi:hypothetical protein
MKKWAHEPKTQFSKEEVQKANKYIKKCPTSLAIKEIQIKTTLRFHLTPVRRLSSRIQTANVGKDKVKQEPLHTVGGNNHYGNQNRYGSSSIKLPYDAVIPLLSTYILKEIKSGYCRGTCTLMFIAALFTIAKLWKQLNG